MQPKRFLTLFLVVILLSFAAVATATAADSQYEIAVDITSTAISENPVVKYAPGDEIVVTITVKNSPSDLASGQVDLYFDPNAFEFTGYELGTVVVETESGPVVPAVQTYKGSTYVALSWYWAKNVAGKTGVLVSYHFTVKADAHGDLEVPFSTDVMTVSNDLSSPIIPNNEKEVNNDLLEGASGVHNYGPGEVIAPTCKDQGYTLYTCQDGCGATYKDTFVGTVDHKFEENNYVSNGDAKCGVEGTESAACSYGCGTKDTRQDVGSALKHSFTSYVSNNDAKCGVDGTKTAVCDNGCGTKDTRQDVGSALKHSFTSYVSNNDAKCEIDGTKTAVCDNGCGATDTVKDNGSALDHDYVSVVTEPDCVNGGFTTHTCNLCNYSFKDSFVNKNGHDYYTVTTEASCDKLGTVQEFCHDCDYAGPVKEVGETLPHLWSEFEPDGKALCTDAFVTEVRACSACSATEEKQVANVGSGAHDMKPVAAQDPTCGAPGWESYEQCSRCDHNTKVEIPATGKHTVEEMTCENKMYVCSVCDQEMGYGTHTYVEFADCDKPQTCPECGDDLHKALTHDMAPATCFKPSTCNKCGLEDGEALVHVYTDYVSNGDAQCEVNGTKTALCDNGCGTEDTVTDEGSALEHVYTNYVSNGDAQCEVDGTKTATCDNGCGKEDTVVDEGSALEHTFTNYSSNGDATCTADGTETAKCDFCGVEEDTRTAVGSMVDHKYVAHEAQAPDCTNIGWNAYRTCEDCDYTEYEELRALLHDLVDHAAQDPDCLNIGWDAYQTCNRCDHTTYVEKSAYGHALSNVAAQAPTCTAPGWDAYEECSECDYTTKVEKGIVPHAYTNYVSNGDATCIADGTKTATCDICKTEKDTVEDTGSATNHASEVIAAVAATCTTAGKTEGAKCSNCGEILKAQETVAALGHKVVVDPAVEPTYSEEGKTEGAHCETCGEVLRAQEIVPVKSSAWIWILVIVIVVVLGGGVAAFFILKKKGIILKKV